jgi:hypothetical protein
VAYDAGRDVERLAERKEVAASNARHAPAAPLPDRREFLVTCIAEELAFASRRLDALGKELADDPVISRRHAGPLQHITATARVLDHLNRLLSSDAPEAELAAIGPDDLRRRLERAPPRTSF